MATLRHHLQNGPWLLSPDLSQLYFYMEDKPFLGNDTLANEPDLQLCGPL